MVRVVDVGAGLCCVIEVKDSNNKSYFAVYDTGNSKYSAKEPVGNMMNNKKIIDYLVLSHVDSDHVAGTRYICENYHIRNFIRTGFNRPATLSTWRDARNAVEEHVIKWNNIHKTKVTQLTDKEKKLLEEIKPSKANEMGHDINMSLIDGRVEKGTVFLLGPAKLTLISGYGYVPEHWETKDNKTEGRNAISIVLKLTFKGKSILFCGDAVGRDEGNDQKHEIDAEKDMISDHKNNRKININSDIMIAAHHGGNDASSAKFIETVSPSHVIFSAGSKNRHPREETYQRFKTWAESQRTDFELKFYRTDYGDDEDQSRAGKKEWKLDPETDISKDDDVIISIDKNGKIDIDYEPGSNGKDHIIKGKAVSQ